MKFKSRIGLLSYLSHRLADSSALKRREYVVCEDISNGHEFHKIPAFSYKRDDQPPLDFHYVRDHIIWAENIDLDLKMSEMNGCSCSGDCSMDCACTNKVKAYNSEGRLSSEYNLDAPEVIVECNARCRCNRKQCGNMVIQNGCKAKLALISTKSRGWGVRAMEPLKRGTFLGVYSGELVSAEQSFRRADDTYLFNLASSGTLTVNQPKSDESLPVVETDLASDAEPEQEETEQSHQQVSGAAFVCDAKYFGNFTRFINHSCEPNVIGIRTFTAHQDSRFPHISFFAREDIPINTELSLNYGENYWIVKCKRDGIYCLCKKPTCRYSKKSYPETLRQYKLANK